MSIIKKNINLNSTKVQIIKSSKISFVSEYSKKHGIILFGRRNLEYINKYDIRFFLLLNDFNEASLFLILHFMYHIKELIIFIELSYDKESID